MNQHDAWVVKNMWNMGANCGDIAYALDCHPRTVRRCIDRNFEATDKKREIADRKEKFFPDEGSGNYIQKGDKMVPLPEYYSEQESMLEAEDRIEGEIDRMTVERLIHTL